MGFNEAKKLIIRALQEGKYQHEARDDIDNKNLLNAGEVSADELLDVIKRCNGTHHSTSVHHFDETIEIHILKRDSWYIKFYFIDPDTYFISVHK